MIGLKRLGLAGLAFLAIAGCRKDSDDAPPIPLAASALEQFEADGMTPLGPGTVTGEGVVVLQAAVSASPEHSWIRLRVEVVLLGASFTGQPTASSDSTPNGGVATAVVLDLPPGGYEWRVWAEDPSGRTSPYVEFGGPGGPDFIVDPTVPTHLGQFALDGATPLATGQETPEAAVVLKARVHSPQSALARAQFEVKPIAAAFDGTGLETGMWAPAGKASEATVRIPEGDYRWRARTEQHGGSTGAWVSFGTNGDAPPAETDFRRGPAPSTNLPPDLPFSMGQFKTNLVTQIGVGGSTAEGMIALSGWVNDPEGGRCALEVEVKPVATPFDGTGLSAGPFAQNYTRTAVIVPVGPGSYHWRARVADRFGAVSGWVAYGLNSDAVPAAADFVAVYGANASPYPPSNLRQYRLNGTTPIPYGESTPESGLVVNGYVTDPDFGSAVLLQVEIRPAGTPFLNVPMAMGALLSSGSTASVRIDALRPGTTYRWQARCVDPQGAASSWIEFTGVPPPPPSSSSGGGSSSWGGSGTGGDSSYGGGSVTTGGCATVTVSRGGRSPLGLLLPALVALAGALLLGRRR